MKKINIPFTAGINYESTIDEISAHLDSREKNKIDSEPWPLPGNKPEVSFTIMHSGNCIYLKYLVEEDSIRAQYRVNNEPVYQDSCVEFFISLAHEVNYYNFEFNCIGTCLMAAGPDRHNRQSIPSNVIDKIKRGTLISTNDRLRPRWELVIAIPVNVFTHSNVSSLNGLNCRANFYKCGDKLPQPHFFAWNNIELPLPDFHCPAWFGELHFDEGK